MQVPLLATTFSFFLAFTSVYDTLDFFSNVGKTKLKIVTRNSQNKFMKHINYFKKIQILVSELVINEQNKLLNQQLPLMYS